MTIQERESKEHIKEIAPIISQAYQLGKQRQYDEAFYKILPYLKLNEIPQYFYQPAGWTIYRFVKTNIAQLTPIQIKTTFDYYFDFCEKQPNLLHSYIMVLALTYHKTHQMDFSFTEFCQKWGLDNFMEEDFKPTKGITPDGKEILFQSLVVKAATALYKELKSHHTDDSVHVFLPFFKTVKEQCPEYEFTPLYIANLHAWMGESHKAQIIFEDMLRKNPKWYIWQALGNIVNDKLKMSCYCKALTMVDKEDYAGELHITLASLLVGSDKPHAAAELAKYVSTYKHNGWKLRAEAYELEKTLTGVAAATDQSSFYEQNTYLAEEAVYQDFPQKEFVYSGNRQNKKGKTIAWFNMIQSSKSERQKTISIYMPHSALPKNASIGDIFLCRYQINNHRPTILTIHNTKRHLNTDTIQEPKTIEGIGIIRKREEQPYAFINKYFVPPKICQSAQLKNNQQVKFLAQQQPDGRYRVVKIFLS